jgi:hypothetical protein
MWCVEAFYGLGFRVSEFCFFWFFLPSVASQESILFGLLKVSQACLELEAGGMAGGLAD